MTGPEGNFGNNLNIFIYLFLDFNTVVGVVDGGAGGGTIPILPFIPGIPGI